MATIPKSSGRFVIDGWEVPEHIDITYQSPHRPELPSVFILATGGTIAGSASSSSSSVIYDAGTIGIGALVNAVPELLGLANIYGVQVCNIGSYMMVRPTAQHLECVELIIEDSSHPLQISRIANDILNSPGSPICSVVVTHGTDTLEETALFLDLTVPGDRPVVIVGAMRPATALSADGPANLYQAVAAGVSSESMGRGCLVVLNDRIGSAFYTQKTHASYGDTFRAPEAGCLGGFFNNRPFYYYAPATPTFKRQFDIGGVDHLPRVDILYGHQDADTRLLDFVASLDDVKGVVVAFPFAGSTLEDALMRVAAKKPVVTSSRINSGMIRTFGGVIINAGFVNTQKARIMLQLALATGADPKEVFDAQTRSLFL